MRGTLDPFLGFRNPPLGFTWNHTGNPMGGKPKVPKTPGYMRSVLAQNMHALMPRYAPELTSLTAKQKKLGAATGLSLSTMQRIMAKDVGPSLDNIEQIAEELGVKVYQLLLPSFDVDNPQTVKGAEESERKVIRAWKRDRHGERGEEVQHDRTEKT